MRQSQRSIRIATGKLQKDLSRSNQANCQEHTDLASNIDVLIRLHKMLCC